MITITIPIVYTPKTQKYLIVMLVTPNFDNHKHR